MSSAPKTSAYLRTEEAPLLPPPISMVGIQAGSSPIFSPPSETAS